MRMKTLPHFARVGRTGESSQFCDFDLLSAGDRREKGIASIMKSQPSAPLDPPFSRHCLIPDLDLSIFQSMRQLGRFVHHGDKARGIPRCLQYLQSVLFVEIEIVN